MHGTMGKDNINESNKTVFLTTALSLHKSSAVFFLISSAPRGLIELRMECSYWDVKLLLYIDLIVEMYICALIKY